MDDIYKRIFSSVHRGKNSHSTHLRKVRLPGIATRVTHPIKVVDPNYNF
jgi:hypothetical protein